MRIFDIQRFSLHDGPGIRTTVFAKGCPLSCAWCHNPESQRGEKQYMVSREKCRACGICPGAELAGRAEEETLPFCPSGARRIAGYDMSPEEIAAKARRDLSFYEADDSPDRRGGVTLGGGEPLAQWEEVFRLSGILRDEGIHVALDTSGWASPDLLEQIPEHFDLCLLDFKALSPELCRRGIGVEPHRMLTAQEILAPAMGERLWITVPVIPGFHTQKELAAMKARLETLPRGFKVRVIPYHRLGQNKYAELGRTVLEFPEDRELYRYACSLWGLTPED